MLKTGKEIPDGHYESSTMKQTVVPFRNGIMLAIACGYAESIGANGVVIAAHSGDHEIYPDCREPFMETMAEAMKHGVLAGRLAYKAGRIPRKLHAAASSPIEGML